MVFWLVSPVIETFWFANNQLLWFVYTAGYKPWLLVACLGGLIIRLLAGYWAVRRACGAVSWTGWDVDASFRFFYVVVGSFLDGFNGDSNQH